MNTSKTISDEIVSQAGSWLLELQAADVPVERVALWQQWLATSEQHARAFNQLQLTWNLADRLAESERNTLPWPTAGELARDESSLLQRFSRARAYSLPAAAALVTVAVGLGLWLTSGSGLRVIETPIGEHRELRLTDGSRVFVGAGSRLRVAMDPGQRSIELERGEAYFQVAKDASRPFSVRAGSAAVTAIGTAFNVSRAGERVVVGVSEGAVAVLPAHGFLLGRIGIGREANVPPTDGTRLNAGQRLVLEANALTAPEIEAVAPPSVGGWRQGRLQYTGEPLSFVLADISRYSAVPIVLADPSIAGLRVTGAVSEKNIESWLMSLQSALPVAVIRKKEGGLEVRRRGVRR